MTATHVHLCSRLLVKEMNGMARTQGKGKPLQSLHKSLLPSAADSLFTGRVDSVDHLIRCKKRGLILRWAMISWNAVLKHELQSALRKGGDGGNHRGRGREPLGLNFACSWAASLTCSG